MAKPDKEEKKKSVDRAIYTVNTQYLVTRELNGRINTRRIYAESKEEALEIIRKMEW